MGTKPHTKSKKTLVFQPVPSATAKAKGTTTTKTPRASTKKKVKKTVQSLQTVAKPSSTRVSPLPTKKKSSKSKQKPSKKSIPKPKSLKISVAQSTTKGKASRNSWKELIDAHSASWSLPVQTDSAGSPTTYSSTSSTSKELRSKWFKCESKPIQQTSVLNQKWQEICSQLLITLPKLKAPKAKSVPKSEPVVKKSKPTSNGSKTKAAIPKAKPVPKKTKKEKPPATRVFKYRITPSKDQIKLYDQLFDIHRFIHNKTIELIEKHSAKATKYNKNNKSVSIEANPEIEGDIDLEISIKTKKAKLVPSMGYLARKLINIGSPLAVACPWIMDSASDFRGGAVRECIFDYKSAFSRYCDDNKPFKMSFRSKHQEISNGCSFAVPSKHWNNEEHERWFALLPKKLRCLNKRSGNKLPSTIKYAARLKRYPGNKYFICIPMPAPVLKPSKDNLLVIDPGYRTCFTGINFRDNVLEEIGNSVSEKISLKLAYVNKLRRKVALATRHRTRYHLKRLLIKASQKVSNLIDDLHKASAKYMCENFSTILIPKLNFHTFLNVSKKTKSMAARVSHCRFVDCLINKSKQYTNCNVFVVDEAYTSKTCSRCGHMHYKLGPSKVFVCPKCNVTLGRDENAVYNILMKALSDRSCRISSSEVRKQGSHSLQTTSKGSHLLQAPSQRNCS